MPAVNQLKKKYANLRGRNFGGFRGLDEVMTREVYQAARDRGGHVFLGTRVRGGRLVSLPAGHGEPAGHGAPAAVPSAPARTPAGCPVTPEHVHNKLPVDERIVAWFGDGRVTRQCHFKNCELVPEDILPPRRGRRPLAIRWRRAQGGVMDGNFSGASERAWAPLLSAVGRIHEADERPDFVVLSIGFGGRSGRSITAAEERAELVAAGLTSWLTVVRSMMPNTCAIILAVIPEPAYYATGARRALAAELRQIAREHEALFVNVEEVMRRHLADTAAAGATTGASATGASGRTGASTAAAPTAGAGGRGEPDSWLPLPHPPPPSSSQPTVPPVPSVSSVQSRRGFTIVTEERLQEVREDLRRQIRRELRQELLQELRQELERDEWKPKIEVHNVSGDAGDITHDVANEATYDVTYDVDDGECDIVDEVGWKPAAGGDADDVKDAEPSSSSSAPPPSHPGRGDVRKDRGSSSSGFSPRSGADVPWESGWVPGRPPPVSMSAPTLPHTAFFASNGHLELDCSLAIKRELMRAIVSL